MRPDMLEVLAEAKRALEESGLAFALVGANAFSTYTLPRATLDLDLLVEAPPRPLDQTLRGLQLAERARDVFFDQDAYIFEVATYVTPIEMFVATHWLPRAALARRRSAQLPGFGALPVVRPDDAALLKAAVAAHPARFSSKRVSDVDDLRRLREAAPEMDAAWMKEAAQRLGAPAHTVLREAGFPV